MKEKTYLAILKWGSIASLLIVFFVFKDLLFPYITSKQISFNILTELLFAVWLVFIMRFPAYRPKKNLVTYGLIAYLLAIVASCLGSVDMTLSIWGDAERMLGVFHVIHFFLLYLILITVFRSWPDWRDLFLSSIVVATLVSLIGIFGPQTYSTIGNTAYVSGYLIFNIFFALILFVRSNDAKWRWLYFLPLIVMLIEFWSCHTSGAIIGLFTSLLLAIFLLGLFHDNKKIRFGALFSFAALIIIVAAIFSQNDKAWFQNSFLKNLTSQKVTFQTRLISWKSAAKDFHNHPWLGTGFGNYAIVFDKHFDSKFYDFTTSETYFDRAHNNLIDIASTGGIVSLLTYLSIFIALFYYLISEMKKNGWRAGMSDSRHRKNFELIIIAALVAAYFIQNLAIFDSFVTYIGLMMTLGFVYFIVFEEGEKEGSETRKPLIKSANAEIAALIILLIVAYSFTSSFNIKPKRMLRGTITGYSMMLSGQVVAGFDSFKNALNGGPLERDSRVVLINLLGNNPQLLASIDQEKAKEIVDYTISLAEKNVSYNPHDSLMQMQLAQVLDVATQFYVPVDKEKAAEYSARAFDAIDASVAATPGRATVYLARAQMYLIRGNNEKALEDVNTAINLNPNYYEGNCRLAQIYSYLEDNDNFDRSLDRCVDTGGDKYLSQQQFMADGINYLIEKGDLTRAIKLGKRLVDLNPGDAEMLINLAKIQYAAGNNKEAFENAAKAASINPIAKATWEDFLKAFSELE